MNNKIVVGFICGLILSQIASASGDGCALCGTGTIPSLPKSSTKATSVVSTKTIGSGCALCGKGGVSIISTVTKSDTAVNYSDFSKKQTVHGFFVGNSSADSGSVTLKLGKISKGKVKVSATLQAKSGKKYTASSNVEADADAGTLSGNLSFSTKTVGLMKFEMAFVDDVGFEFSGSSANGYVMSSDSDSDIDVDDDDDPGVLGSVLAFSVDSGDIEAPEGYDFISDPPYDQIVYNRNGKWSTEKAPKIGYKTYKEDGEKYFELTGLDDEDAPNISGLKLSFKEKKGTFSGSFKIYASNELSVKEGKKPSIKKYSAKVKGVITGSTGHGTATVKIGKNKYELEVTIETSDID